MTQRSKLTIWAVLCLVFFGLGLASGYFCWGRETRPTDYRKLLLQVANYMDGLEQQNAQLNDKLAGLERQAEQGQTASNAQAGAVQQLQTENERLRSGLELNAQLQQLKAENAGLRAKLNPAGTAPAVNPN